MHNYQLPRPPVNGLTCRKCGCRGLPVVYTRHRNGCVVRSRKCENCGTRLLTKERPAGKE